jgi:hypothetical protein
MEIKKITMFVHTSAGTYEKTIAANKPSGYTNKDIESAEKWSALLQKEGVESEV